MPSSPDPSPSPATLRRWLGPRLLSWFAIHQRSLPWRHARDPYSIWISEVMLQQTQAATVIPYYERFLKRFPTLSSLAEAEEQDVLRLWEGLGYYRRARDLHRAARLLQAEQDGVIPADPAILSRLPGMGRYTCNAVLSQAFDSRLPIIEANSQRVLCRFFGRTEESTRAPLKGWLWKAAEDILPRKQAGEFNQALMELGALICTPAAPKCEICPLRSKCAARSSGLQETIPFRQAAPAVVEVRESAVVLRRGRRVLLVQRPAAGRWASLWEFPHGELERGETHEAAALRLLGDLVNVTGRLGPELLTIRHGVTRFRITMVCFEATIKAGRFRSSFYQDGRWLEQGELGTYPVSAPQRRLIAALTVTGRQQHLF